MGLLAGNEKWIVSVFRVDSQKVKMDEFYLYSLDLIYGVHELNEAGKVSVYKRQYIGTDSICRIRLKGSGVAAKHGAIGYDQDFGMIYMDRTSESGAVNKNRSGVGNGIEKACVFGPYGSPDAKTVSFIEIRNGLKLYVGEFVLLFEKEKITHCVESDNEYHEEYGVELSDGEIGADKVDDIKKKGDDIRNAAVESIKEKFSVWIKQIKEYFSIK